MSAAKRPAFAVGPAVNSRRITHLGHICCGQRLTQVDINSAGTSLTFTYCGRCEALRWFKDGVPTDDAGLNQSLRDVRGDSRSLAARP